MPDVDIERPVAGGFGLGHDESGRVVLVSGGLPGDRVSVEVRRADPRLVRGSVAAVIRPSPDRVAPPCPTYELGCGGCDLQALALAAQPMYKEAVVRDALRRIGGLQDPIVRSAAPLPAAGFRTTVRAAVEDGLAGLRARASHDVVRIEHCHVAHPLVDEVLRAGRFPGAVEVTVRAGARTGERLVVVHRRVGDAEVPAGAVLVGTDELARGRRAWYHEEVGGRRWRISARSFFQSRPDGAEMLIDEVRRALGELPVDARLLDAHCGVGLFGGSLAAGRPDVRVLGVERSASAVADARHNLDGLDAQVVRVAFERWRSTRVDVAVADPPRGGLGRAGVERLVAAHPARIALVSCDAAALGRDASLLLAAGYVLEATTLVDLFPHTSHVECVSAFRRA